MHTCLYKRVEFPYRNIYTLQQVRVFLTYCWKGGGARIVVGDIAQKGEPTLYFDQKVPKTSWSLKYIYLFERSANENFPTPMSHYEESYW